MGNNTHDTTQEREFLEKIIRADMTIEEMFASGNYVNMNHVDDTR